MQLAVEPLPEQWDLRIVRLHHNTPGSPDVATEANLDAWLRKQIEQP